MHFANDIINVKNRFYSSSNIVQIFFQKLYDCKQPRNSFQTRFLLQFTEIPASMAIARKLDV